ncbi:PucR family transcriptional regulator [Nocardia sp. NPDC058058]|uniref:PucR family transcriptional regulator n=1 Tax=Nocardia sp. NPDC058058 TaxID=3346317 RepID=UPI0036DD4B61
MRVDDLLQLENLALELVWGGPELLRREIGGVTATDLLDPSEYLRAGEVVLSGLVWWTARGGRQKADRFAAALRNAGAVALLAGVVRHGGVPEEVQRACREHGIVLVSVPAETTFRTITDEIYLRRWGALTASPHSSLPDHVRRGLERLIREQAEPTEVLDRIAVHLGGLPCALVTASGRTVARSSAAPEEPAATVARSLRRGERANHAVGESDSPYGSWYLRLPGPLAPPRPLREVAEMLRHYRELAARDQDRRAETAATLIALLDRGDIENPFIAMTLDKGAGLYRIVTAAVIPVRPEVAAVAPDRPGATSERSGATSTVAQAAGTPHRTNPARSAPSQGIPHRAGAATGAPAQTRGIPVLPVVAVAALSELLAHRTSEPPLVAARGEHAVGIIPVSAADDLTGPCELVRSCAPDVALHLGFGSAEPVATLRDSLIRAIHACRAGVRLGRTVTTAADLTTLAELLAGVPNPVRETFSTQVLGELLDADPARSELRATLTAFLDNNGSWTRTAEALYLHVNTVHYRIERIEKLTGRDLSRLDDRIDLRAALHARTAPPHIPRAC